MANANASSGTLIAEIAVVIGIFGLILVSLIELAILSTRPISENLRQTQAILLAEEALEAVRSLRDISWSGNIASLHPNETYYLILPETHWSLTTANPGLIDNLFNRTVTIENAVRDGSDNISATGALDPNTKRVTAAVTWIEHGRTRSVTLATYLTNFLNN